MALPSAAKAHAERNVSLNGTAQSHAPRVLATRKAAAKSGGKPSVKPRAARSSSTGLMTDHQKAIEMLREIDIDGKALSAQIDRIIQRYL